MKLVLKVNEDRVIIRIYVQNTDKSVFQMAGRSLKY